MKETKVRSAAVAFITTIIVLSVPAGLMYEYFYLPKWIFMVTALLLCAIFIFTKSYMDRRRKEVQGAE